MTWKGLLWGVCCLRSFCLVNWVLLVFEIVACIFLTLAFTASSHSLLCSWYNLIATRASSTFDRTDISLLINSLINNILDDATICMQTREKGCKLLNRCLIKKLAFYPPTKLYTYRVMLSFLNTNSKYLMTSASFFKLGVPPYVQFQGKHVQLQTSA